MKMTVRYAGLTDLGTFVRRTKTTDSQSKARFVHRRRRHGWAICRGAGLEGGRGDTAGFGATAFRALEGLPRRRARRRMAKAIATLSTQMRRQTQNEPGLEGMGSTVVCALVRGNQVLIAHMGDSRAYRLRAGQLNQLTKDHSLIELLLSSSDIKPEEAATHPARGRLTRNVGMDGEPLPQTRLLKLKPVTNCCSAPMASRGC